MSFKQNSATEFTVTHSWNDIELVVDIDFNVLSVAQILAYTQNHYNCPRDLCTSDDAVIEAFLKLLAMTCFRFCLFNNSTVEGLIDHFTNSITWGVELFPPMDGSKGIIIKSFTFDSLEDELFELTW
ncbi:DUF2528 family protein [Vibrio coralliirubri]|uniref:DUF2528 family protein n=1 Tax=Vibrio coralliirubri TaxID=1516159 RepID=UPI00228517EF|nr:DUF2528 family protein [Vibrio coralliirubri]MCY9861267.1 DUF2528 family protein [Vibrio coralliirubri]